jgi:excisionase family DNA binding protein
MNDSVHNSELLTSSEVASLLGVGPTSVKRWADAGLLACIKTPGNHRRFSHVEVARFRLAREGTQAAEAARVAGWIERLRSPAASYEVHAALLSDRSRLGAWWLVAEHVASVLVEIGLRWERGEFSILEEHLMTERLSRGLTLCSDSLPVSPQAPTCLLAMAEGDDHIVSLRLAELCLRECGWKTQWGGRALPTAELAAQIESGGFAMLALSASESSQDAATLAAQVDRLVQACRRTSTWLVLGGKGLWPEPRGTSPAFERPHSLREFHALLDARRA